MVAEDFFLRGSKFGLHMAPLEEKLKIASDLAADLPAWRAELIQIHPQARQIPDDSAYK